MHDNRQIKIQIILPVLLIALVCASILFMVNKYTYRKIQENARVYNLRLIESVITIPYDNDIYNDFIRITEPVYFGNDQHINAFRIRKNMQPAGIVLTPVPAKGYSGKILLTIGITYEGELMGVRVFNHRETEGLGDQIDHQKSDWIEIFNGESLKKTPAQKWAVATDGGQFDELSGATITSRGVINTVRNSLEYYQANRDRLYKESKHKEEE